MPKNINCITIIITLEGIERKSLKEWQRNGLKNISLTNVVRTTTAMAALFSLAAYLHCTII